MTNIIQLLIFMIQKILKINSKAFSNILHSSILYPIFSRSSKIINSRHIFEVSRKEIMPMLLKSKKENESENKQKQKQPQKGKQVNQKKQQKKQDENSKEQQKDETKNKKDMKSLFNQLFNNTSSAGPNDKPPSGKDKFWKIFEFLTQKLGNLIDFIYKTKVSTNHLILCLILSYIIYSMTIDDVQLTPKDFLELMKLNSFENIQFVEEEYLRNTIIKVKKIEGKINGKKHYCCVLSFNDFLQEAQNNNIKYKIVRRSGGQALLGICYVWLDSVFMLFILGSLMKSSKNGNLGTANMGPKAKKFQVTKNVKIKFTDVAGLHESKQEVQEVVDFLKNPSKYHALGATIPKGVLLTGPPGTGKTLLAKATAGEAEVPFYSVSGSDFVQVFVGVGASRVRQLFRQAKQTAPSIIFIDELDAIGKKRQNKLGSNDERESTLNQLLVEMDGFETNSSVILMGATNLKQTLDDALVRPGRFDRQIQVGLPDLKGRFQILLVHLKPIKLSQKYTKQDYANRIASLTPGFSGAQLANLCNQAAILAARCGKQIVQMLDFEISSERVIGGVERKGFVSEKQKKTVAYHESGHAVVSWFLEGADPLLKVTIIPRSKGALGFAQYFINENQLQTKQQLLDRICFILGGRCAELHFFNEVTTGAYDDLQKAYNIAYHLVAKFGMNTQLGYIAFPDIQYKKPYGENVEASIDKQIKKIINECTLKTKQMIKKYQKQIIKLSQELIIRQTIDTRIINKILGPRPFAINKTFESYLQTESIR